MVGAMSLCSHHHRCMNLARLVGRYYNQAFPGQDIEMPWAPFPIPVRVKSDELFLSIDNDNDSY